MAKSRQPPHKPAPPPTPPARKLVFISAAEPSADLHGANLIRAAKRLSPDMRFVGVAGPRMVAAGCDAIFDMTRHSAMLLGALGQAGRAARVLSATERYLRMFPIQALVVIDSPMLHLPMAARAKAAGVPVLYYIAPQLWAWAEYRIRKVRERVDRMAVILPFEEPYFRDRGVDATYVGHPLADQFEQSALDDRIMKEWSGRGSPRVALLPGSRKHVVQRMLPDQLKVAARIAEKFPGASFGVSVANPQVAPIVGPLLARSPLNILPCPWHHAELIATSDLALVTSGTTTLEVAFHRKPMIVMYQASRLFYHLFGRWVVRTPWLSLPNILAGREVVPEFMPFYRSIEPLAEKANELLSSSDARESMQKDLEEIVRPFRGSRASERTAEMLLALIERNGH